MVISFPMTGARITCSYRRVYGNNMPRAHTHRDIELYFLVKGERYLLVGNRFLRLCEGEIALICNDTPHRTLDVSSGEYERLTVNIPPELIPREMMIDGVEIYAPGEDTLAQIRKEAESLAEMNDGQGTLALAAVMRILDMTLSSPRAEERAVGFQSLDRISEILDYIEEHYTEKISLTGLSERFYISEFYLCRLFKQCTGKNLSDHLSGLRISRAEKLLKSGEGVARVAFLTGFGSVSAFSSAFRKRHGTSASAYRKKLLTTK